MPVVTAIEQQARRPRANVHIDGAFGFAINLDLLAVRGLHAGSILSPEGIAELQREDLQRSISDAAWRLLSYRTRSRDELRQRLLRKRYPSDEVDTVLDRLGALGHLNDEAFAESWVQMRQTGGSPRGRVALRGELRRKGVDAETVEAALADVDEEAAALRAGEKRARSLASGDYLEFRRRLMGFLQRRGFSSSAIKGAIEALWQERGGEVLEDEEQFLNNNI